MVEQSLDIDEAAFESDVFETTRCGQLPETEK